MMKPIVLLLIANLFVSLTLHAEVITDGSLGAKMSLSGPDFQIEAKLGQQHGSHLFHSFQDFNLQSHESATFSGSNSVTTIINRVTGGNPSTIDGLIRSTIPNADVYFLNPYGIMFGSNAKLDVQGGFHASTADYLRLQDGGRFEARYPNNSLLTTAPIETFGFLTDSPAKLSIENSQLSTIEGKTFSLVGGDLSIQGGQLFAPQGRFNLVSVAQIGEIAVADFEQLSVEKQGLIEISDRANLNVDGEGGGEIFIRGGQLMVEDSVLQANTLEAQDGRGITMRLTEGINLNGKLAEIASNTVGLGSAGDITIITPRLTINQGQLLSNSFSQGAAGNIYIETSQMTLYEGGHILNESYGADTAGSLTINAKESLSIIDKRIFPERETAETISRISSATSKEGAGGPIAIKTSQLLVDGGSIISHSYTQGNAGKITIEADSVDIINGGLISATILSRSSGNGGNISFKVKDTIHISGYRAGFTVTSTDVFENMQSAIAAVTFGSGPAGHIDLSAKTLIVEGQGSIGAATGGVGDAGHLTIEVDDLFLNTGGLITISSGGIVGGQLFLGTGAGGTAKITARNSLIATGRGYFSSSGILSNTLVSGQGGNIEIETDRLYLADGAEISANSLGSGQSGELMIRANTVEVLDGGEITTSAQYATGGDIYLAVAKQLYLRQGQITTSVQRGDANHNGGNITVKSPQFVVLNQGKITAQAYEGQGGNIRIVADQFIKSPDSLISASSQLGLDGNVNVEAPADTISDSLIVLSSDKIDAAALMKKPCSEYVAEEERSHFYVHRIHGVRPAPHDRQGSDVLPAPIVPQTTTTRKTSSTQTAIASSFTECQKTTQNTIPLF